MSPSQVLPASKEATSTPQRPDHNMLVATIDFGLVEGKVPHRIWGSPQLEVILPPAPPSGWRRAPYGSGPGVESRRRPVGEVRKCHRIDGSMKERLCTCAGICSGARDPPAHDRTRRRSCSSSGGCW